MDTRQPPAPNSYPPAAPWAGGPPIAPGQPPGLPGGYPGGAWPTPPSQPPPQAPRKRGARAAFVGLSALLIVGVMVAAVIFTGAAAKLTGKSSATATPTTSTAVAQVPASSGQVTSTTIPGATAVPGTTVASIRSPNATGTAPLTPATTSGGQPTVVATPNAKPLVTRTAGVQATAVGTSSRPLPTAASVNLTNAETPGTAPTVGIGKAQVHGLNQPVTVPGWIVTVTKVERPGTDLVWSADNDTATATSTWVVVVVTMKKTVNGTDGIVSDAFTLRSGQGFTVPVPDDYWVQGDFYATFKHTQPFGKSVPPGATVTYTIPFDVAADATDLRLVFAADANNPAVFAI